MSKIRPLRADDEAGWLRLWRGYLEFYKTELADEVTEDAFARLLKSEPHFGLVAEENGRIIGFAHCLLHPSTWSKKTYCYLEDLFVDPSSRGSGAGRKLIEAVYAEADKYGCARVYWATQEGNRAARRLYDNLATKTDFVQYRRR